MSEHIDREIMTEILSAYGFFGQEVSRQSYIDYVGENGRVKLIFLVTLSTGESLVVKILHEEADLLEDRKEIESQSRFSEFMRKSGIRTPKRYAVDGIYCTEIILHGIACNVTVEDWCGEEIREINCDIAGQIGSLMARMHRISLENQLTIGCGTLFSAAYWNDVDSFDTFCELCEDERLDQVTVSRIKELRQEKLMRLRAVWETLPKAAVQGDISINNLVLDGDEIIVFDYNNAGDEVLVSDLILEGLLTAYEMELPDGIGQEYREQLFPALLRGYLSVRPLTGAEVAVAWDIYTLYHGLWFTRIVYNEDSLQKLVERGEIGAANQLLADMLKDMTEKDDGRFASFL